MAERPWLTIIGLGEDGPDGLSPASLAALNSAEIVMGPPRHLSLLPEGRWRTVEWPVPFSDGISLLTTLRGQRVVVLASGDPFWHGAGSVIARHFARDEWRAIPAQSVFSNVATVMGWPLEKVLCIGLHAAPLTRLRPHLSCGARIITLLRDGKAVQSLADYIVKFGFADSQITVCEALSGPRERVVTMPIVETSEHHFDHPVSVALEILGEGRPLSYASGLPDDVFDHDGQMTKRPVRALTLSTLAPQYGEHLWDIGGGSGSIAIEWLLAHPSLQATCIEANTERAKRIESNALALGVDRLKVINGTAPSALSALEQPHAVFVGGGLTAELIAQLEKLPSGTRLVANAVTLEAEALLTDAHERLGGTLMRIDISQSAPLGSKRGWQTSYPIVQWSVTL